MTKAKPGLSITEAISLLTELNNSETYKCKPLDNECKEHVTIGGTSTRTAEEVEPRKKADFENVHIFSSGTFNGKENTPEMLKDMVQFMQDHSNYMADLKLDHIDSKGERDKKYIAFKNFPYSLGKVKGLKTSESDKKLFGSYYKVFKPIKEALKDKLLTTHSAEVYYNVTSKKTGKKYKAVLGAVALLPAGKMPALWSEFDPYMYKEDKENIKAFFSYEEKATWSLNQANNDNCLEGSGMTTKQKTEDLEALKTEKAELKKFQAELEKARQEVKEAQEALNADRLKLSYSMKQKEVESFVSGLIESEEPQLLPNVKEKAVFALMAADQSEKKNYSIGGEDQEKSAYELLQDFMSSLPKVKGEFSQESIVPGDKKEASKPANILGGFAGFYAAGVFQGEDKEAAHKATVSQAKEMGLDLVGDAKTENYAMAQEAVKLAQPELF